MIITITLSDDLTGESFIERMSVPYHEFLQEEGGQFASSMYIATINKMGGDVMNKLHGRIRELKSIGTE